MESTILNQLMVELPIAGALIWLVYTLFKEFKAERKEWTEERKEMYNKMSNSHNDLRDSIVANTNVLGNLGDLIKSKL